MNALALQSFGFGDQLVRVVERDDVVWFVAKDVCAVLEISNHRHAVAKLEEDEKGVVNSDTLGGSQELTIVSESGVFGLIFRSRKPAARAFRKWVTSEVLPAIRRTGRFEAFPDPANDQAVPMERLPDTPDEFEMLRARLQLVREARIAFGAAGARRAWAWAGLPDVSEPDPDPEVAWIEPTLGDRWPSISRWMRERLELAPGHRVPSRVLFRDYQEWAAAAMLGPDEIYTETAFGRFMTAAGISGLKSGAMWRRGIKLRD